MVGATWVAIASPILPAAAGARRLHAGEDRTDGLQAEEAEVAGRVPDAQLIDARETAAASKAS